MDYQEALGRARTEIARLPHEFVIHEPSTVTRPYGWVFRYAPRKFLETGDPNDSIPGNGPIVIMRDGRVFYLPTSKEFAAALADFERRIAR